ncbi:tol-pal system-associated acyl-CoA thioesterase [Oceaniserpentilla sp. 4NH20-0058]|uniref:tol-pal system-associated acyl-CoA thioesterase n=1 Tax=Oceaniserpentilla sp. 4NH20-0058 TaxID=3127660 RepID=UPI00310272C1
MSNQFQWPVRVYYEDTDAGGIVYHARYLYFLERARTEWLREAGFNQSLLKQQNTIFVVRDMQIKWQQPATLDELLTVITTVTQVKKASMVMAQTITCGHEQKMQASVTVACVHGDTKKPMAMPDEIIKVITDRDE